MGSQPLTPGENRNPSERSIHNCHNGTSKKHFSCQTDDRNLPHLASSEPTSVFFGSLCTWTLVCCNSAPACLRPHGLLAVETMVRDPTMGRKPAFGPSNAASRICGVTALLQWITDVLPVEAGRENRWSCHRRERPGAQQTKSSRKEMSGTEKSTARRAPLHRGQQHT